MSATIRIATEEDVPARTGFRPVARDLWFPGLRRPEAPMTLYRLDLTSP